MRFQILTDNFGVEGAAGQRDTTKGSTGFLAMIETRRSSCHVQCLATLVALVGTPCELRGEGLRMSGGRKFPEGTMRARSRPC